MPHKLSKYILSKPNLYKFETVLDIGCGLGQHTKYMAMEGKELTLIDERERNREAAQYGEFHVMDFMEFPEWDYIPDKKKQKAFQKIKFNQYDLVWCSHCLEHQKDTQSFLEKIIFHCKDKTGILVLIVPPLAYSDALNGGIVGGHVSIWTLELLLYRLVLVGLDVSQAQTFAYKDNIAIITPVIKNDPPNLLGTGIREDLKDLAHLFPPMIWGKDSVGKLRNKPMVLTQSVRM